MGRDAALQRATLSWSCLHGPQTTCRSGGLPRLHDSDISEASSSHWAALNRLRGDFRPFPMPCNSTPIIPHAPQGSHSPWPPPVTLLPAPVDALTTRAQLGSLPKIRVTMSPDRAARTPL